MKLLPVLAAVTLLPSPRSQQPCGSRVELARLWSHLPGLHDKDGDGRITKDEYTRRDVRFASYDRDGAGVLAAKELKQKAASRPAEELTVVYEGKDGPGKGKHVVLVSGDEEYRSEEALPQLGKILAEHHGFKCTVTFAIDPKTGEIDPNHQENLPGLEALQGADLMVIATRFRNPADDQMKHIVDYVESGRPILGLRTATHAFRIPKDRRYARYDFRSKEWKQGFGRQVLGETWINHHGGHGRQSTRGILAKDVKDHPILRGIEDGDIWGDTDVYGVRLPLPDGCTPLVYGQVLDGMTPDAEPSKGKKNDPMMPVAWIKTFEAPNGKKARVFTTTMGAATDFRVEGSRRMFVNAVYWSVGLEDRIPDRSKVDIVGTYEPTRFGFKRFKKGVRPRDLK